MSSSVAKVSIVKDKDLADMFNQMLGAGTINMNVVYPKYVEMKTIVEKLLETLTILSKLQIMSDFGTSKTAIIEFIESSKASIATIFSKSYDEITTNLNLISDEERDDFSKVYEAAKQSELVNVFMFICNDLCPYRKYLERKDPKFVITIPGSEFCPFPFAKSFDIKGLLGELLLNTDSNALMLKVLMEVLTKIYELSYRLYKILGSPDIDVDEFVDVIMRNIGEIKKRIPRCDKAFDKIINSVHLLKNNFPSYYRDFLETNTSTIIMENFVIDVSRTTKTDAETTRQFKTIIEYYRKMSESQIKNPKIKKLFDAVGENFKFLEQHENLQSASERPPPKPSAAERKRGKKDVDEVDEELLRLQEENETKSIDELLKEIRGKK